MLTPQQRQQFQQADANLDAVTLDRLSDLLGILSIERPVEFKAGVFDTLPGLIAELGDVSAIIGGDFYETSREQADAPGRFTVDLSDAANVAQVQSTTGWALSPMFDPASVLAGADLAVVVRDRLQAGAMRLVREGGRKTITENSARDPAKPRYRRVLSAGKKSHCDFCSMLAGRGFVYHTKDTAGAGKHWHDRCGCGLELGWNQ